MNPCIGCKLDTLRIALDFVTCKANYFYTLLIEPSGSDSIFLDSFGREVPSPLVRPIVFSWVFRTVQ
jgi:hypothetical protein